MLIKDCSISRTEAIGYVFFLKGLKGKCCAMDE